MHHFSSSDLNYIFQISDLQTGLPFARLKLKPVQRMSCMLDYEVAAGTEVEAAERKNKRQSRAGLALGGKCQASGGSRQSNNLGQCFLCQEPATTQVTPLTLLLYLQIEEKNILTIFYEALSNRPATLPSPTFPQCPRVSPV